MSLVDPQATLHSLTLVRAGTYVPVASAGLFLYDYSLTLYDEVRLVWKSPWSLGKVLFFLTRYPAFVDIGMTVYHNLTDAVPVHTCELLYQITGWMFISGMIIAEVIMAIRVWALWNRSKLIGIVLLLASIVGAIVTAVFFALFNGNQSFIQIDTMAPELNGCYPDPGNNVVFIGYLMLMAYETVVMILLLVKGVQDFRQVSLSAFLYTFYQDGIAYYALLLLISISNVVILLLGPREYANLLTTLQRTLHSLLSARVLLHLRISSARRQQLFSPAISYGAIGSLMFAEIDQEPGVGGYAE